MRLRFYGGFGEKGRTCLGLEAEGASLFLDVGVNAGVPAFSDSYYPALTPDILARQDAILVSHGHEDHLGALGWCVAQGFSGRILMTAETAREVPAILGAYGAPEDAARVPPDRIETFSPGETVPVGAVTLTFGRTGHAVGGVWVRAEADGRAVVYCDDVVPSSAVFAMDPLPEADVLVLDASYGGDLVPPAERTAAITAWCGRSGPKLLPVPIAAKPLELLRLVSGPVAIHAGMRASLAAQVAETGWLQSGVGHDLTRRLAAAQDWREGDPLPDAVLFAPDGMGLAGPSAALLDRFRRERLPVLLTGHLPSGSPADLARRAGEADWLRMPTHPVLAENLAMVKATGARLVLGHSCLPPDLEPLAEAIGPPFRIVQTGESLDLSDIPLVPAC